jgi:hypothetical protein
LKKCLEPGPGSYNLPETVGQIAGWNYAERIPYQPKQEEKN